MGDTTNKTYTAPDGSVFRIEADGSVTKVKNGQSQTQPKVNAKYHLTPDGKIYQIFPDGTRSFIGVVELETQSPSLYAPSHTHSSADRFKHQSRSFAKTVNESYSQHRYYPPQSKSISRNTKIENQQQTTKNNSQIWKYLLAIIICLGGICAIYFIVENISSKTTVTTTYAVGSMEDIHASRSFVQEGLFIHYYEGQTYAKDGSIRDIMLAFVENEQGLVKAIYKNMEFGGKIKMRITYVDDQKITLQGKDGNNDFSIELASNIQPNRLIGEMRVGSKSLNVRMMPSETTFNISSDALY